MILPLDNVRFIPTGDHPGAFAAKRKYDIHTGVDLYCNEGDIVYAMEDGEIVGQGYFTGPEVGSHWWNTTQYLMIKGANGIICYGEIKITCSHKDIQKGDVLGYVIPVLKEEKIREDIPYHSNNMLHIEMYSSLTEPVEWLHNDTIPSCLEDPTEILLNLFLNNE